MAVEHRRPLTPHDYHLLDALQGQHDIHDSVTGMSAPCPHPNRRSVSAPPIIVKTTAPSVADTTEVKTPTSPASLKRRSTLRLFPVPVSEIKRDSGISPPDSAHSSHEPYSTLDQDQRSHAPSIASSISPSIETINAPSIAPSIAPSTAPSYGESLQSSRQSRESLTWLPALPVSPTSTLPISPRTLLNHDALTPPAIPPKDNKRRSWLLRQRSQEGSVTPVDEPPTPDTPPPRQQRIQSFQAIDTTIPSSAVFEDINSPERLDFSHRGSILVGGQRMERTIPPKGYEPDTPATPEDPETPITPGTPGSQTPTRGLRSGPRKPSGERLRSMGAARVLSAEEHTFSQKLRSIYEYGDEAAADWTVPARPRKNSPLMVPSTSPERFSRERTPEPDDDESMNLEIPRRRGQEDRPLSGSSRSNRLSYIAKETEAAGGVEDWEDISGNDVDRYGFIKQRVFSDDPSVPPERVGLQRVATSLQLVSDSPRQKRRLMRGPSSAHPQQSARAVSQQRPMSQYTMNSPESVAPTLPAPNGNTARGVSNPFRSRERRAVDEASDMLTLPPNMVDAPEQEPTSEMRRREYEREEKWRKMAILDKKGARGGGMTFTFDTKDPKVIERTWKGIPDSWRATAWHAFLSSSAKARRGYVTDAVLIEKFLQYQDMSSADDVQIDVDVPRTINLHIMFRRRYRGGQRLLFRVLHAISIHFPDTGYVQGMAALAATLLCYYDEENTFVMLVRMWQLRGLEVLYREGFSGLLGALKEFDDEWLSKDTEVNAQLTEFGIDSMTYGTRWYLTLFNMSMPFPAQLRVWDVFMLLGDAEICDEVSSTAAVINRFGGADLTVLHATSAALIDATRTVVLESDFENAMKVLTSWIPIKDEDVLMRVVKAEWKMKVSNRKPAKGVKTG